MPERAERVVELLRSRGVFAHVRPNGLHSAGIRIVLRDGSEAIWDADGAAALEAQVMRNGMLVGFVPSIPGSADYDDAQVVEAIVGARYVTG